VADTRKRIEERRSTPVRLECDVLVAGGGTAGCVAALAAARQGAATVLVERYGFVGGTMINGAGPLHSFFNLWKAFPGVPKTQVVRGIPEEIVRRLVAAGGSFGHLEQTQGYSYDSVATIIDPEIFKHVMLEMLAEAGVRVLFHAWIADAVVEDGRVRGLFVESKSGREALLARVVVDCTGDGDVAARAGAPCRNAFPDAAVGMPFGMTGVDIPRAVAFFQEKGMITQLVRADKGAGSDDFVRIGFDLRKLPVFEAYMDKAAMWGPLTVSRHGGVLSYINTANIKPLDALDVEELSRAERVLRGQIMGMAALLREHIPGFEKAAVTWSTTQVGVRRTRIIECEHDLSLQDILEARRFEDEVALYGFHDMAPRLMISNGGAYGIPYRALLPKKIDGVLVAGRMITTGFEAHMSTRNTVSCMAQGQAAGTAAALASRAGVSPRQVDVRALREALRAGGVYLGD
jgi:hypothetical protein